MGFTLNNIYTGMSIPREFVRRIQDIAHIPYFIETGTAGGQSVAWAKDHFDKCWTIEIDQTREITKVDGVNYHAGNTQEVLPDILSREEFMDFNTPIFFWLDAHWCEPNENPNKNIKECYLLEEIEATRGRLNSVVFIDDARLFAGPPPYPNDPRDWPRLDIIFRKLNDCLPNSLVTIVDDFIICVPPSLIPVLDQEWVDNYKLRYRSEEQLLYESVSITYDAFLKYINKK